MSEEKIPTIFATLFIIFVIATGAVLIKNPKFLNIGVSDDIAPKDVRISNVTNSSFSVSWVTNIETVGSLKWDVIAPNLKRKSEDALTSPSYTHLVTIVNLSPSTAYYFVINSDNHAFDNNGTLWQVKTGPRKQVKSQNNVISGTVLNQFGSPVNNALVYITVGGSSLLSTTTSENGSWILSISGSRTKDLDNYISIDKYKTLIEIFVQAKPFGNASAQIYPISAKPAPSIVLGQTHNFKAINLKTEKVPKAKVNLPENDTESPGFPTEY